MFIILMFYSLCNESVVPSTVDTSVICISGVLAMMTYEAHVTISFGHIAAQHKVKPHSLYVTTQNLCMVSEVKAKTTMALSGIECPQMHWDGDNLKENWRRFKQHVELMFSGPLKSRQEAEKCSYLLIWVGQKGRDIYNTWTRTRVT